MNSSIGHREARRLAVLDKLEIMDTKAEQEFDDIVKLAAMICHTPISLMSLLDKDRQWFKAKIGITLNETKREIAFCHYTIQGKDVMIVPDATLDNRFRNNPLVTGPEQIRFYAGTPLILNGHPLGTLCVIDQKPREMSAEQIFALRTLGQQVTSQLELRYRNQMLEQANVKGEEQKANLNAINEELNTLTQDLLASEEDTMTNLEQINALQIFLEARKRQYRELVEHASDLIYELDEYGRFSYINKAMEVQSGSSTNELLGKFYLELVHPEDVTMVSEFYKQQRNSKKETSYLQFRMLNKGGDEIWIGQNVRMFFNAKEYVTKVSVISRDITALKQTQLQLAKSEKLYRIISTNSKDLIGLLDLDTLYKFVSPSVHAILGYRPEDLIATSFCDYIYEGDLQHVNEITSKLTLNGKPATIEYRAVKKDGTMVWLECNSNPIFDESGKMTGFQTSARDISHRKEFEATLKEAKEKAEEATHAKSQFLSMMSHEIRTPMNAILGLTTLMMENNPRADQQESLRLLKFSGENLLTLINEILDLSKIEANKLTFESVNLDLKALITNVCMMMEQRAVEKGIVLEFDYDRRLSSIFKSDPVRLSQILINLLGNAIKFTEKGKVSLLVESKGRRKDMHQIKITIKDTGIGIAKEKLQKIFERFSQAESDTTRKYGGTGLGLSITKSLLELMGSQIDVQSAPGKGSEFSFTLELKEEKGKHHFIHANPATEKSNDAGINVLLVEDNKINQLVASGFLKKWGINSEIANNGAEAVAMIQSKTYQLVLMDLQMPEMDGYEACTHIRQMEDNYFKTIPIIALTASAMLGMKDKVLTSGMNDFISKPFAPEELHSKIIKYVAAYREQTAA